MHERQYILLFRVVGVVVVVGEVGGGGGSGLVYSCQNSARGLV